ncbi:uncharacterized protein [Prorops nasuta]|uniref:uncharacterized protein n=1 Tax=Prorops nasuta TaxID=863751 RepID=UPI0034CF37B3
MSTRSERRLWIFDEYRYFIKRRKNDRLYLSCIKYKKLKCSAHGIYYNNRFHLVDKKHNHEPDKPANKRCKFFEKIKEAVNINNNIKPNELFNIKKKSESFAKENIPFTTCRRTLQRYLTKSRVINIKLKNNNFSNLAAILKINVELDNLRVEIIESNDKVESFIFYSPSFFDKINGDTSMHIFVDGTFKCVPNLKERNMQLLSIFLKIDTSPDKVFPCVWILMQQKRTEDYIKIFNFLKAKFSNFRPKTFMADYERALSIVAKRVFPEIKINHCFFHYSQALMKKAQVLSLVSKVNNKNKYPERYRILKKLTLLALLPPIYIKPVFELIKTETQFEFQTLLNSYFKYYELYWINKVTPNNYSVYECKDRTNNYCESYHRTLNQYLGKRPNINLFLNHINLLSYKSEENLEDKQSNFREKKRKTIIFDREILHLYKKLDELEANPNDPQNIKIVLKLIDNFSDIKMLRMNEENVMIESIRNIKCQKEMVENVDDEITETLS